jgi:formylglycine-generating enzyme required for sulfatase activity
VVGKWTQYQNYPVVDINWYDARQYVEWLRKRTGRPYRLLTEAEWEYAARAGTTTRYWFGNEADRKYAFFKDDETGLRSELHPANSLPPNPFGLVGMVGNVWQWVQDCYAQSYASAPSDGTAFEPEGCPERVTRGGSFEDESNRVRSAERDHNLPIHRENIYGLRVARSLTP